MEYCLLEQYWSKWCWSSSTSAVSSSTTSNKNVWPKFKGPILLEGFPYLECEVAYQCRYEMVCTVKDMISLRLRIAYLDKEAALVIAPKVADLMAKELRWSKKERDRQLQDAIDMVNTFGGPTPNNTMTTTATNI